MAEAAAVVPAVPEPVAKVPVDVKVPEVKTPTLEEEIATKFGEDWKAMPPSARKRVIDAEEKIRAADKKYQGMAAIQKEYDLTKGQVNALIANLKSDPLAVLKNPALGANLKSIALQILQESGEDPEIINFYEERVWDKVQDAKMTPEQREARDNKKRLEALEKEKTLRQKEEDDRKNEQAKQEARTRLEKLVMDTLESEKMPKDTAVVSRMAYYMKLYRAEGKGYPMQEIAQRVKQDFIGWQKSYLHSMSDDQLLAELDGDFIKRLRKKDLERLRATGQAPKPGPKVGEVTKEKPSEKIGMMEWRKQRAERLGRK